VGDQYLAVSCLDALHAIVPELKAAQNERAPREKAEA
jgi:hypothetical protein